MTTQNTDTDSNESGLIKPAKTAAYLGTTANNLARMRWAGEGPTYIRLGKKSIRYRLADLDEYIAAGVVTPKSRARESA